MLHIVSEQLIAQNAFDLDILNAKMLYIVKVHSAFVEGLDKSTHGRNARPRILAKGKKDVFEGNALDRHFGQSVKVACTNLAIDALQISEGERTEIRCALVYGKAFSGVDIFAVAVGVAAVIPHIDNKEELFLGPRRKKNRSLLSVNEDLRAIETPKEPWQDSFSF